MALVYDGYISIDGVWHRGLPLYREREPLQWLSLTRLPAAWDADRYERNVARVLDSIFLLSHTGAALRQSITQRLDIVPWIERGKTSRASHGTDSSTPGPGYPYHFRTLLTEMARHGLAYGIAPGTVGRRVSVCDCPDLISCQRSNLYISYTPEQYPRTPVSGSSAAGNCQDEVLLHEMVHSIRRMVSLPLMPPIDLYDNMDEFAAILVTNYFSAEHGRRLRNSHRGPAQIRCAPRQWLNTRVSPRERRNRHYLQLFCRQQPDLARRLNDSPQTVFNPIRQMLGLGTGS